MPISMPVWNSLSTGPGLMVLTRMPRAACRETARRRPHDADLRVLGGDIADIATATAAHTRETRRDDDRAAAREIFLAELAGEKRAAGVDHYGAVERILRIVGERRDEAGIAGVAEDHVNCAPAVGGRGKSSVELAAVGDIADRDRDIFRVERGGRVVQRALFEVEQCDARAFCEEAPRRCAADAAGAAAYHANLVVQQGHAGLLWYARFAMRDASLSDIAGAGANCCVFLQMVSGNSRKAGRG
jgi:hypothetical protein